MKTQSAVNLRTLVHMLGIFLVGTFSLVLVVELGIYADPNVSRTVHDYALSYHDTEIFALNGLTVPLSVWLQLVVFELLCLFGAFRALRSSCRVQSTLLIRICGVGYLVCAVIPLSFSQIPSLIFG